MQADTKSRAPEAGLNPVIQAIRTRRTIRKFKPNQHVGRELVEAVLDAATWAPNHYMTEPWRFVVISGDERGRLGTVMADALAGVPADSPITPERLELEKSRPLGAEVIIALISCPKEDKKIVPQEELVAAAAALQNLLLAAHSVGLATNIRTGWQAYTEPVRKYLAMKASESLIGFVYLGYPEGPQPPGKRTGLAGRVDWRGMQT